MNENDIVYYKTILKKHKNILLGLQKRVESDKNTLDRISISEKIISEVNQILKTGEIINE